MSCPTGFTSWKDYFSFSLAKEFVEVKTDQVFFQKPTVLERLGQLLSKPFIEPVHLLASNVKNPVFIVALSTAALTLTSIAFYPEESMRVLSTLCPPLQKVESWMVHFAAYVSVQTTISALCLRTLGRLSNDQLLKAWQRREIKALHIGSTLRAL